MKLSEKVVELSNKELIAMAPSVGQTQAYPGASDKYSFISTIEAVNHLRDSGWLPVSASQSAVRDKSREGFQKHMIRFSRPDLVMNGERADMLLYNAHDTFNDFSLLGGFFKFVCSNGVVVGEQFGKFSHRHLGFKPEAFIEDAEKMNGILETAGGVIEDWKTIDLEKNEQGIFAQASLDLLYEQPTIEPVQLLEVRRPEDAQTNLWQTFNTIQENLIKGGLKGKSSNGRSTQTKGITSIDRDRAINQTLWQISNNIFEIKNAA